MKWDKVLALCLCICLMCSMAFSTVVFAAEENNELDSGNSGSDVEVEETEEEKNKRWYDYLIDGFETALNKLFEPLQSIKDSMEAAGDNLIAFKSFQDIVDELFGNEDSVWNNTINEITGIFNFTNAKTNSLFTSIWELPIVKELSVVLVFMLLIAIIFALFKSF